MQQRGFTLIELIIVIVILGILSVVAAPKFIDIRNDAVRSTVFGVEAALSSTIQLVNAKSVIDRTHKEAANFSPTAEVNGQSVLLHFGYPSSQVAESANISQLQAILDIDIDNQWDVAPVPLPGSAIGPIEFGISPKGTTPDFTITAPDGASCHVFYAQASANPFTGQIFPPTITTVTGAC